MKDIVQKLFFGSAFILCGTILSTSCVNEKYDFEKELDMEVTILNGMSVPVGSFSKIQISDILEIDEASDIVKTDSEGNFLLEFSGESLEAAIEIPDISFKSSHSASANTIASEPVIVHFPLSAFNGFNPGLVDYKMVYSTLTGSPLSTEMDIEIDADLPDMISDVKSVELDAVLTYKFYANVGKIYIPKGFKLEFPEDLHFTKFDETHDHFVVNDNVVTVDEEVTVVSNSSQPYELKLRLDKIDIPAGSVKDSKLLLNEHLKLMGDFYIRTSDFTSVPNELYVEMKAEISNISPESALVKVDIEEQIDGTELYLDEVPDFLSGVNISLDLYNPTLLLSARNTSPIDFAVSSNVVSTQNGQEKTVSLGNDGKILFAAGSQTDYLISRRSLTGNYTNIVVPEIADLMKSVPEKISIEDIKVNSANDDYVSVSAGSKYDFSFDYNFSVPLAFGENMNLSYEADITDLGLAFEGNVTSAILTLDIVNSMPISFNISAIGLDSEGNALDGLTLTLDKVLPSGTHTSPTETSVKITLSNRIGTFNLDGLRLSFVASAPSADHVGIPMNKAQGLELKQMSLTLPEGLTVDLSGEDK